ncbi:MAG: sugar phosphate nucleotidyltransferase [Myxococcota bacterium]
MNAILLCAGYATRMGALTENFPKALLPVSGRPILADLVDQLADLGRFERLAIVTNRRDFHHFERWKEERLAVSGAPLEIVVIDDGTETNETRLGAIGDLALALRETGFGGPLLVGAGDNLFRFDLEAYLADFDQDTTSMVLIQEEPELARRQRSGVAELDEAGRLIRLWEKPEDPPSLFCCPPLYLLNAEALAEVEPCMAAHPGVDAPGNLIAWIAERLPVRTHPMRGERLDVGNAESYHAAQTWLERF